MSLVTLPVGLKVHCEGLGNLNGSSVTLTLVLHEITKRS